MAAQGQSFAGWNRRVREIDGGSLCQFLQQGTVRHGGAYKKLRAGRVPLGPAALTRAIVCRGQLYLTVTCGQSICARKFSGVHEEA